MAFAKGHTPYNKGKEHKVHTPKWLEAMHKMKGRKFTEEHKRKIGQANAIALKGKKLESEITRQKLRDAHKGEKAYNWKGDNGGYHTKHSWLKTNYGKASKCQNPNCRYPRKAYKSDELLAPKRFEWANISGRYFRDRNDYIQLCPSCHRYFDLGKLKLELKYGEHRTNKSHRSSAEADSGVAVSSARKVKRDTSRTILS